MPGRRHLLAVVALAVLCGVFVSVGVIRIVWGFGGGSFPTSPVLLLVVGAACLAGAAIAAFCHRAARGTGEGAVATVRAGFALPAFLLVAAAVLPDITDLGRLGALQWLVVGAGAAVGFGVLVAPRLVAGGLLDRMIDTLAGYGAVLVVPKGDEDAPDPTRFARFVVFGSLAAALANTAIPTPLVSQAVRPHDEAVLDHLVATEQAHLANNYRLYAELRELGAGAAIIVPPQAILATYTLEGLSLLEVRTADYDPELSADLAGPLLTEVRYSGDTETELDDGTRPYVVAVAGEDPAVLRLLLVGGAVVVVDDAAYRGVGGAG